MLRKKLYSNIDSLPSQVRSLTNLYFLLISQLLNQYCFDHLFLLSLFLLLLLICFEFFALFFCSFWFRAVVEKRKRGIESISLRWSYEMIYIEIITILTCRCSKQIEFADLQITRDWETVLELLACPI